MSNKKDKKHKATPKNKVDMSFKEAVIKIARYKEDKKKIDKKEE